MRAINIESVIYDLAWPFRGGGRRYHVLSEAILPSVASAYHSKASDGFLNFHNTLPRSEIIASIAGLRKARRMRKAQS